MVGGRGTQTAGRGVGLWRGGKASQQRSNASWWGDGETYRGSQMRNNCNVGSTRMAGKVVGGSWKWSVVSAGAFAHESEETWALLKEYSISDVHIPKDKRRNGQTTAVTVAK